MKAPVCVVSLESTVRLSHAYVLGGFEFSPEHITNRAD